MQYHYYINLDERGYFYADVRDCEDNTLYEIHGFSIFEDGFMSDKRDLTGLSDYLKSLGLIGSNDNIVMGK